MGDYVIVFRPIRKGKLENQWQSPFIITNKITEVTYQVDLGTSGKRDRTFHVNCMKQWISPAPAVFLVQDPEEEPAKSSREKLTHSMPTSHHMDLKKLKEKYKDVLKVVPGKTTLVQHDIPKGDAIPIRFPHYRLAHHSKEILREEIGSLLDQEIIKSSKSPWAAPIVLEAKKDGTKRMCVDYRKLNNVATNDPYSLPNIEELIANIGPSKFIRTLDLTKGYYQVQVNPKHCGKTAFVTPLWQVRVHNYALWFDLSPLYLPKAYGRSTQRLARVCCGLSRRYPHPQSNMGTAPRASEHGV